MPQAARTSARATAPNDKEVARAQEQEFKRARGAISCAECRRLKLKCDKTIPCSSCKRRGCASICPNGSLATGQGTRFILADTDRLHRKIEEMSDRIRQLEDALAILQSTSSKDPHPLLQRELLEIKSGLQLHSARLTKRTANRPQGSEQGEGDGDEDSEFIDAMGTLEVRDHGAATFYGRSAGSESILLAEKLNDDLNTTPPAAASPPIASLSPLPVAQLAGTTFPAAPGQIYLQRDSDVAYLTTEEKQELLEDQLPPWLRAQELCRMYLEQAPWFFGAVARRQLFEEVVPLFYPELQAGGGIELETPAANSPVSPQGISPSLSLASAVSSSSSTLSVASSVTAFDLPVPNANTRATLPQASPHDLALMFVVFCFGALTDPNLPPAPHNTEADRYYELTRAALNLSPVFDRPPSVVTVQTLSLMGIYQGLVADSNSIESTWALMGMSCKLAQSIGLHRDGARWKLPPAEVQKRRALFWELFITDCWQGLATGRLPTFSLPYIDAELAADPDETIAEDGTRQPSFPSWKAMWGRECVSAVAEVTLQARAPKYSLILELDRKIRDTPLPRYAQGEAPKNASLNETMSHYMPNNYREFTLLYVHRCFFAEALKEYPSEPMRSQYAPSFMAGYRSACALVQSLREQFAINPIQIARFWVLWTHAFSSTIMLAAVVIRGGTTKMAEAALGEVRIAYDLFHRASMYGGRAVKFLPIVRKQHDTAVEAFNKGLQLRKDIFASRTTNEGLDGLSLIGGATRTVALPSPPPQPPKSSVRRSASRRRISPSVSSQPHSQTQTQAHSPAASASGSGTGSDSVRSSQSPAAPGAPELPSLASYGSEVHPMLVDSMRTFEQTLEMQIERTHEVLYSEQAPMQGAHVETPEAEPAHYAQEHAQGQGLAHGVEHGSGQHYAFQYHVEPPQAQEYEPAAPPPAEAPVWGYASQPQEMLQQHPQHPMDQALQGQMPVQDVGGDEAVYHAHAQHQYQHPHPQQVQPHMQTQQESHMQAYESHPHAQAQYPPEPVHGDPGQYYNAAVESHEPPMVQGYQQYEMQYAPQPDVAPSEVPVAYGVAAHAPPSLVVPAHSQSYPHSQSHSPHEQVAMWHDPHATTAVPQQDPYTLQYQQQQQQQEQQQLQQLHHPSAVADYSSMHGQPGAAAVHMQQTQLQPQPQPYHHHHQHRAHREHRRYMHQQQHQHQHEHEHPQTVHPPPPPVFDGHSLQETWTEFMQQELPGMPGPMPPRGGPNTYQGGVRR